MALTQDTSASVADGGTVAFASNLAANALLVAIISFADATTSVVGITDTRGNNWQLARRQAAATKGIEIWYAANANAGADTLTCDWSATATAQVRIAEFDGFAGGVLVDQTAVGANDTTSPQLAGSITTTKAVSVAIAGLRFSSNFSITSWSDSFTALAGGVATNRLGAAYRVTATQPLTLPPAATCAANEDTIGVVANFYADPTLARDVGDDALKLADVVLATLDPLRAELAEGVSVTDTLTIGLELNAEVAEALTPADVLVASRDLTAELSESLTPVDQRPPNASLTGGVEDLNPPLLTETLLLDDIGQGVVEIIDHDGIKIVDGPVVAELVGGDLAVAVGEEGVRLADTLSAASDLTATSQEDLRMVDVVEAALQIAVQVGDETIRITDSLTASRDLTASLQEDLKVSDADLTVTLVEEGALAASISETLRLTDAATVTEDPLEASVAEGMRLSDVAIPALQLAADVGTEALLMLDTAAALIDPEEAALSETLRISDTVQASRVDEGTIEANLLETVLLSDTIAAAVDPMEASVQEALSIADALSAAMDLVASQSESVRLADVAAAVMDLSVALAEAITVSDVVSASRDLEASQAESARVQDSDLSVALFEASDLVANPSELLHLADTVEAQLDHLSAVVTETARIADAVLAERGAAAAITSIAFSGEAMSVGTFGDEAMSGNVFGDEAMSDQVFSDEELLP